MVQAVEPPVQVVKMLLPQTHLHISASMVFLVAAVLAVRNRREEPVLVARPEDQVRSVLVVQEQLDKSRLLVVAQEAVITAAVEAA